MSVDLVEGTDLFGDAFEHFVVTEACKAVPLVQEEIELSFFRTSDGGEARRSTRLRRRARSSVNSQCEFDVRFAERLKSGGVGANQVVE